MKVSGEVHRKDPAFFISNKLEVRCDPMLFLEILGKGLIAA
jgi:hypothetical protein